LTARRVPFTWLIFMICSMLFAWTLCAAEKSANEDDVSHYEFQAQRAFVELFITVKRGSRFVDGLDQTHFTVYEDGAPQELTFFQPQEYPLSVALLLDNSASVRPDMAIAQAAAVNFVDSLRNEDEVCLVSFGGLVRELVPLTTDLEQVNDGILSTSSQGRTHLNDAIALAVRLLSSARGRKAIVLFTDGMDTASGLSADSIIRNCGRWAIPVFAIGVGVASSERRARESLEELADRTGGETFFLDSYKDLRKSFDQIARTLKASYWAGYARTKPADGEWHRIRVVLRAAKGKVLTRDGFLARQE